MRKLIWGASFRRAFRKAARKKPHLSEAILDAVERLALDPFEPALKMGWNWQELTRRCRAMRIRREV